MNGDNFRSVSAEVSADVLTQYYAMEEAMPRGARPVVDVSQYRPERNPRMAREWSVASRDNLSRALQAYHARRLGIEVSDLPTYRFFRKSKGLTEAEAVGVIRSSRTQAR